MRKQLRVYGLNEKTGKHEKKNGLNTFYEWTQIGS
jgi:hypothetical protein